MQNILLQLKVELNIPLQMKRNQHVLIDIELAKTGERVIILFLRFRGNIF